MEPSQTVGCLWFLVIMYMFYAQHTVCDAYFVPAINVFCGKMRKSKSKWLQRWGEEAVAGATLCALGCNGPEMFTNLIALFTGSDAGIGVVVGSEIFNLLVIIGCTIMAAPASPLQLQRLPYTRDILFYFVSIILLYIVLEDKAVSAFEAWGLLGAAGCYVLAVYFTSDLKPYAPSWMLESGRELKSVLLDAEGRKTGMIHGVEVEVEEVVYSRLADGRNAGETSKGNLEVTEHGIKTDIEERSPKGGSPRGVINGLADKDNFLHYEDLHEVVVMDEGVICLNFYHKMQNVSLKVKVEDSEKRAQLLKNLELFALRHTWIHDYDATIFGAFKEFKHKMTMGGFFSKIFALPVFFIDLNLKGTLFFCDVKDLKKENRYPFCFFGAMCWLAFYSWMMLEVADQIHYNIPAIPSSFLGITVCAVGTSFPNCIASIIMAQQNKPAAAIANALGSNVQNVFLAMALPWVIYSHATGGAPIDQNVAGITEGVWWMMGTLILVVFVTLIPPTCAFTRVWGPLLCVVYLVYLVQIGGETFGYWEPLAN